MKRIVSLCLFCATFLIFSGCAKDEEDVTGSIYGIVSDAATGEPVSSANVSLSPSGKSVVTGNDGRYEFPGLTPGQYTVQVTKNEYESNTKQITVVAGEQASGDITLQQASSQLKLTNNSLNFGKYWSTLSFGVGNAGITGSIEWRISAGEVDWISVTPLSGSTETGKTTEVVVSVLRDKVSGPANGIITISDEGGSLPIYVTVNQEVEEEPDKHYVAVAPEEVVLTAQQKEVKIYSYNGTTSYEMFVKEADVTWLSFTKPQGTIPSYNAETPTTAISVGFIADLSGLSAGEYRCTAVLRTDMGELEIPVRLTTDGSGAVNDFDEKFWNFCLSNYDTNQDGLLSDEEIAAVTEIDCSGQELTSLQGIERFENLTSLDCSENFLTTWDVSNKTKLSILNCGYNQISTLDVTANTALQDLNCRENKLTALSLDNPLLTELSCSENYEMTSMDVSRLPALQTLSCGNNPLGSLDVSNNPELKDLGCHNTNLTILDLSDNEQLVMLHCGINHNLTTLDVSRNKILSTLICSNCPLLETLDVSENVELKSLLCGSTGLTVLDIRSNTKLQEVDCSQCESLSTVYVFDNYTSTCMLSVPTTTQIVEGGDGNDAGGISANEMSTIFPDANFRTYILSNFDADADGALSDTEITAVTKIECSNMSISSLKGVEVFLNLQELGCTGNSLQELDLSTNTALTWLACNVNQLSSLNISNCQNLSTLSCGYNPLLTLDISQNTALTWLICTSSQLSELDVSRNTELTYLDCDQNQLSTLDVSRNTKLEECNFSHNQLTSLTLGENPNLRNLDCRMNSLPLLDVSGCPSLSSLGCNNNQLSTIDISNNSLLSFLYCSNNNLSTLDIQTNTALQSLNCSSNQISVLDINQNTALKELDCSSNLITVLDVSLNTVLSRLYCQNNQLSSLDISNNKQLLKLSCLNNESLSTIYVFPDYETTCTISKPESTQIIERE